MSLEVSLSRHFVNDWYLDFFRRLKDVNRGTQKIKTNIEDTRSYNPFAKTYSSHLLKPLMELAKKNNTQLICFSGIDSEEIHNRFDNIYVLHMVNAGMGNVQDIKGEHKVGDEPTIISSARIQVSDESEQLQLLF